MKFILQHPPMGWNSYDYYDTNVNEEQVRANAEYMAAHLKQYGWEYVVVDIQWYAYDTASMREKYQYIPFGRVEMDAYARLLPCIDKFPSAADGKGFRPLADYIHSLGLKFGIHIMRGIPRSAAEKHCAILGSSARADEIADPSSICKWNPDMYGVRAGVEGAQEYYDSIAALYAEWGVDFIKCDDICNTNLYTENPYSAAHEIEMLQKAIEKTGRDIVLSLSPGPALIEKAWHYEKYANMWRITDDFWDNWELLKAMFERCEVWQNHVRPGSFPDCDMLPLGWIGKEFGAERQTNFTREEQKTMMTLWSMFGSPMMIGAELTRLDAETLALLTNEKILKLLSCDYVGRQEERDEHHAIWSCCCKEKKEAYVALFSFAEDERELFFDVKESEQLKDFTLTEKETATELWSGEKTEVADGVIRAKVGRHDVKIFAIGETAH